MTQAAAQPIEPAADAQVQQAEALGPQLKGFNVRPVTVRSGDELQTVRYDAVGPTVWQTIFGTLGSPITLFSFMKIFDGFTPNMEKGVEFERAVGALDNYDKVFAWGTATQNALKAVDAVKVFFAAITSGEKIMAAFTSMALYTSKSVKAFVKVGRHAIKQGIVQVSETTKAILKTGAPILRITVGTLEMIYEVVGPSNDKLESINAKVGAKLVSAWASVSAIALGFNTLNTIYAVVALPAIVTPIVLTCFISGVMLKQIVPKILDSIGSRHEAARLNEEYELSLA